MSRVPPLWAARQAAMVVHLQSPAMVPVVSGGLPRAGGHFGDARPDTPRDVEMCCICKNAIGMSPSRELSCGDRLHTDDCWDSYVEDQSQRAFEAAAE